MSRCAAIFEIIVTRRIPGSGGHLLPPRRACRCILPQAMKRSLILLAVVAAIAQTPAGWTPELSMHVKTIGDVLPSPDAARVAWTQSQAVMEPERSEIVSQ